MKRNAFFDNARVLLIFLVVFGHMLQPLIDGSRGLHTLYIWIYTFHMPAFVLLSGFFAKGSGDKGYIMKLAKKLLLPYFIFQVLYTLFYFLLGKESWQTGLFDPQWSLWFLFSLFSWHLLLILFRKMPVGLGIVLSVVIGLIVGYFDDIGHTFSLSRTFVFFPFFLIGFWLTEKQILQVKRKSVKATSLVIMVGLAAALYYAPDFNSGWLLASKSYIDLGMEDYGGLARLFVYITAAIMVTSILAWVPTKSLGWVTSLGGRTLYVYLLHGFLIQFFRQADLFEVNNIVELLGIAGLSASIVIVLSSRPILGIWQPFIEGKATIIKNTLREI
ncbi:hypothetical protein CWR48_01040 [Oceanobacillus arenosus]|uniref:Acyltransferase 3 domain-containing protein n=1 Tax=Oceanobacillus arenosus TaxID=1229153 RepID=A0A3D8Q2J9_9BACI|nr:acyltransferase family protein [Oceanobacillus arenosus]RDW22322.1 hypothetical protein CWR48_01040 [Oceanobacillus arenosus]